MNARAVALRTAFALSTAAALATCESTARAEELPIDARFPVRVGFAYTNIGGARAPAMSFSWGIDVDVAHITPRLAFQIVGDFDGTLRLDLPDQDLRSGFVAAGLGVGLFYVTEGSVGFGIDSTLSMTFDAQNLAGGGFATRLVLVPFYMTLDRGVRSDVDRMSAWVRSSLSIWVMARADFTSDGNGATLAFGASLDMMRLLFLPYLTALKGKRR